MSVRLPACPWFGTASEVFGSKIRDRTDCCVGFTSRNTETVTMEPPKSTFFTPNTLLSIPSYSLPIPVPSFVRYLAAPEQLLLPRTSLLLSFSLTDASSYVPHIRLYDNVLLKLPFCSYGPVATIFSELEVQASRPVISRYI